MAVYESCLDNRIQAARPYLDRVKKMGVYTREYRHIKNLAFQMRPLVAEIEKTGWRTESRIMLIERGPLPIIVAEPVDAQPILSAIIHENYIHICDYTKLFGPDIPMPDAPLRLEVVSDKERWVVDFLGFLKALDSYLLSRDDIAIVICAMIDSWLYRFSESLKYKPEKRMLELRMPHKSSLQSNFLWLCRQYVEKEPELKKKFMTKFFQGRDLHFSPIMIGTTGFDIQLDNEDPNYRWISWKEFLEIVRDYIKRNSEKVSSESKTEVSA